jgi:hypothetical protein
MDVDTYFPAQIPCSIDIGRVYIERYCSGPGTGDFPINDKSCIAKSLEAGFVQNFFDRRIQFFATTEIPCQQSWDLQILCNRVIVIDAKMRNKDTTSYTVGQASKVEIQLKEPIMIWPLYVLRGDVFYREYILLRHKMFGIKPPKMWDSTKTVNEKYWCLKRDREEIQKASELAIEALKDVN